MLPPCADYSRQIQEPLIGTISQADVYFLLEYNAPFGNKALPESTIPPSVIQHLAQVPKSYCVLIRQPETRTDTDGVLTFFAVNVQTAHLYELALNSYADLLAVDLPALLRGEIRTPRTEPLYAICTNGKRDECCARYGVAFYNALKDIVGVNVWQCSHIGGHRFAATGMVFPQGLCYGYLDVADAPHLVKTVQDGAVWLEKLRGHILYPEAIQAADYFLRQHLPLTDFSANALVEVTHNNNQTITIFNAMQARYRVIVETGALLEVLAGTGDTQFKQTHPFQLVSIEEMD